MAIRLEGTTQEDDLKRIAKLLVRIDNKPYYNDLGQVLGLLIERLKDSTGRQKYYALDQLSSWIETLIDDKVSANQHYPQNILNEVLSLQIANEERSTLLNSNLNRLDGQIRPVELKDNIERVVKSKLPANISLIRHDWRLDLISQQEIKTILHWLKRASKTCIRNRES